MRTGAVRTRCRERLAYVSPQGYQSTDIGESGALGRDRAIARELAMSKVQHTKRIGELQLRYRVGRRNLRGTRVGHSQKHSCKTASPSDSHDLWESSGHGLDAGVVKLGT